MGLNGVMKENVESYQKKIKILVRQLIEGEKELVIWGSGENGIKFKRFCGAIHIHVKF